jgi:hypothetical protein
MENEFHRELCVDLAMSMQTEGSTVYMGAPLPNGRIADVLCIDYQDHIIIFEVKTLLRPFHYDEAIDKYGSYCDHLYIAAPPGSFSACDPKAAALAFPSSIQSLGLLEMNNGYAIVYRAAFRRPLSHDRRELITRRIRSIQSVR